MPLSPAELRKRAFTTGVSRGLMVVWGLTIVLATVGSLLVVLLQIPGGLPLAALILGAAYLGIFLWIVAAVVRRRGMRLDLDAKERAALAGTSTAAPLRATAQKIFSALILIATPVLLLTYTIQPIWKLLPPVTAMALGSVALVVMVLGVVAALVLALLVDPVLARPLADGNVPQALDNLDRARHWAPPFRAILARSRAELLAGNADKAELLARSLLHRRTHPIFQGQVLHVLGASLVHQGRLDEAQAVIDQLCRIQPANPASHLVQVLLDLERGAADATTVERAELGRDIAIRALRQRALVPAAEAMLARAQAASGAHEDARATIAALPVDAAWNALTTATVRYHLGCAHLALGDVDTAVEHFTAVLDTAPQLDLARRAAAARDHLRGVQSAPDLASEPTPAPAT